MISISHVGRHITATATATKQTAARVLSNARRFTFRSSRDEGEEEEEEGGGGKKKNVLQPFENIVFVFGV